MYHYVYKIVFETGHIYYGARTSKLAPEEDVNYVGTPYTYKSYWKTYFYKKFIVENFETKEQALAFEAELIKDFWETFGKDYSLNGNYRNEAFSRLGITHTEAVRLKISEGHSKGCFLISPEGQMFDIPNLVIFCREKGFSIKEKNGLRQVYLGYMRSFKGWTSNFKNYLFIKYYGFNAMFAPPIKLHHTTKGFLTVYNRSAFSRLHKIGRDSIIKLAAGKIKTVSDLYNKNCLWTLAK